ncbi:MAG: NAD+ kinase [Saprospiraceae bacterium]|jgi:NAD+ kinase
MDKLTVGLFGKYASNSVEASLLKVKTLLEGYGATVLLGESTSTDIDDLRLLSTPTDYQSLDFAVVVGGDGTLLHAARALAPYSVPVVGINLGRLGFLTDIPADEIEQGIKAIREGKYTIENRTMITTQVRNQGEVLKTYSSLNDVVISKGDTGRLIEVDVHVNGVFVSRTRSDGMIVATPTGSTAYALSAGGPIVEPTLHVLTIVPISPHTLSHRPIIINQNSVIDISLVNMEDNHAALTTDGIVNQRLAHDDTIRIQNAAVELQLMRIHDHSHFEALRSKLGWSY